jgi:site-specific DNA recombinase
MANVTLQMEVVDRDRGEQAELATRVFELSQALEKKWLTADFAEKRKLLDLVFSNFKLDGVTLCSEIRKPFDVLAKGLVVPSDRGDRRLTFPNESVKGSLLLQAITQRFEFTEDMYYAHSAS